MTQALIKTWWLLALCGVLDAMHAAINLVMLNRDSSLNLRNFALGAFGLIGVSPLVRGPLSFRPVSLLFVVMAVSIGAFAVGTAQTRQSDARERWFLGVAGAASIGFVFSFFAVGFHWVRLESPHSFWIWMSSYFGFCAMFMLWLAVRVHSPDLPNPPRGKLCHHYEAQDSRCTHGGVATSSR